MNTDVWAPLFVEVLSNIFDETSRNNGAKNNAISKSISKSHIVWPENGFFDLEKTVFDG